MTNRGRRRGDKTDAEGTRRLPHIQRALDVGLLNAPPADEPRGQWKIKQKRKPKSKK